MDYFVLSHLRWDFVFQRPQQLFTRCARKHRVVFWEEPMFGDGSEARLDVTVRDSGVQVAVPHLPGGAADAEVDALQAELMAEFIDESAIENAVLWHYTPMAMRFTRHLAPAVRVYDCMDELSAFRGAPPGLRQAEAELLKAADLVFTGGQSLYEAKQERHHSVHCFPSSIDFQHFAKARLEQTDPADQANVPRPRIGYCGVIDERMDLELLAGVAVLRPDWQFVMVGPVVKISSSDLPQLPNIHYLGGRKYEDLPAYMSGWDVAMLPFALNESTRFISPTKTPEYLAAGRPVVSTAITDVVRPYGNEGLVSIVAGPEQFVTAVEECLRRPAEENARRLQVADAFLAKSSWDRTWAAMHELVERCAAERHVRAGRLRTPALMPGVAGDD